jgi:HD-GYP domain-containing protein (c-di-GMP phosphodiesterase class II)
MTEPRLYNSRLIDTYVKLIKARYPHTNVDGMLRSIDIQPYEVADQGHWFTQEEINRFYRAVLQATGNENIAREAGRFSASTDSLGSVRQYILAMLGPAKAFALGGKLAETLTKSACYSTKVINQKSVEVTVRPREGVNEEPFQCQNRLGIFEAIVSLFNYKTPHIEHNECVFKGNPVCRYTIRWQPNLTSWLKQGRDIYAFCAVITNLALAMTAPALLEQSFPLSIIGLFGMNWWLEASRKKLAENTLDYLRDSTEQLNEQINVNHRNIQLSREIGEAITSPNNIDDVLQVMVQTLERTLNFDRGLILLANKAIQRLEIRGAFGYTEEDLDLLETTSFRLDNPSSQGPLVVSYRHKKPILVNDISDINGRITPKSRQFIEALGTKSFLAVPIVLDNESIGVLAVDNRLGKKPLVNSDVNLLMGIAPAIGVSFRNAMLNEARENQFAATLKVLADSIDARDFLTAGHSEKVAEYTVGIATELGKSHDYCQMIRIGALLHDYGKIGVPDTVLKKDGLLTNEERALIKTHSKKSFDILSQVPFEGLNQEIPNIALYHHERWDGTGYPEGLKGPDIPLGARIVAVADFYEAVTSKRHYREPMPVNVAIDLLKRDSGSHFDPEVVHAFLRHLGRSKNPGENLHQVREPRYDYKTPVNAQVEDLTITGETIDISTSGVFLQLPVDLARRIERDALLDLTLDLPSVKNVQISGKVRWVNLDTRHHPAGIGVAFKEVDQNVLHLLQHSLRRLVRRREVLFPQAAGNL